MTNANNPSAITTSMSEKARASAGGSAAAHGFGGVANLPSGRSATQSKVANGGKRVTDGKGMKYFLYTISASLTKATSIKPFNFKTCEPCGLPSAALATCWGRGGIGKGRR